MNYPTRLSRRLSHRSSLPIFLAVFCLVSAALTSTASAIDIKRVVSPGGIEAWLVQDAKVPLLSIKFFFKGGVETDPAGKEGLANLTSTVLDEGAGPYDSEEFQRRMADNSISIGFTATTDGFYGGVHTLVETQDEAVDLARLALTQPRFDEEAVERMRRGVLSQIRRDQGDPDFLSRRALYETAFPDHPYGRRARGTVESVGSITRDDMAAFVRQRFAKDNLTVAVTGDIAPDRLGPVLDRIFGELPANSAVKPPTDVVPKGAGETVLVRRPQPQSVVLMSQPGIKRDDPDWFAATVMNYVLGAGSFSSRLMEEIRTKRGLTYGVYSYLVPFQHTALVMAGGSTANANAGKMVELMKAEWRKMRDHGVTQAELDDAKTYLTGSFPLQFTSSSAIADILLQVQRDNLGIDYLDRRSGLIEAVTLEDVQRVAKRLLDPAALLTVVVGQPEGVEPTRTRDDIPS
ncbi:zinc protease [Skermanella aerolata]|uniref:Peptidase M16 n=1 Tax=Skermanella aerolata TaxID=393310 RepID=A0A512DLW4_9PROT|nr:pitrilysin family protein [Skermanella aerolata]KJB96310.1 zinc protease [Skermanella aerolata KACC 11604]GEO37467.1 peptidase M16 [Skermanella aerolata]